MELTGNAPSRQQPGPAPTRDQLAADLAEATGRIAPLWPLESFVAVNPYFGLVDHTYPQAARLLARAIGARSTLSADAYRAAADSGLIEARDIEAALRSSGRTHTSAEEVLALVDATSEMPAPRLRTYVDVATAATGQDWARLRTDRVSAWAAAHFDHGQALWRSTEPGLAPFASWKREASLDRTPEIMGLAGFRSTIRDLPDDHLDAAAAALDALGIGGDEVVPYVHALLLRVGGWAAFVRRIAWDAGLVGATDDSPEQFAAVLLAWELGVLRATDDPVVAAEWGRASAELSSEGIVSVADASLDLLLVLQDAYDRAAQRRFLTTLAAAPAPRVASATAPTRPAAQAVFCIDVRSEVMRRHLEASTENVETLGFAGFFGLPLAHLPLAHEHAVAQCPVLLSPAHTVAEQLPDPAATARAVEARRDDHHVRRAWKSFKMGAISCFSFVGPVGLAYLPKLVTDGRGITRPGRPPETEGLPAEAVALAAPSIDGIPAADRIAMAEGALRGMSLTEGMAAVVALVGHGSTTTNNPYGNGLDCGACGGHAGDVSARVAAALLNDADVRAGLAEHGIEVPADTWFVAGLHDTTTDDVRLYDTASAPEAVADALAELEAGLVEAGRGARAERARRMGITGDAEAVEAAVRARASDWSQVRPEWGLAGCRAFVAAPRSVTAGADLGGRAFLHSYDRHLDANGSVLTTILTAPVIVASWISLQYFASTVDNEHFGSGDKTLHNVVGRLGVLEGNGGDLRTGLPWQSVHDGERLQHEPLRLQVLVAAPPDAIAEVIAGHDHLRALCDNGWIAVYSLDDDGRATHRYAGGLAWHAVDPDEHIPLEDVAA